MTGAPPTTTVSDFDTFGPTPFPQTRVNVVVVVSGPEFLLMLPLLPSGTGSPLIEQVIVPPPEILPAVRLVLYPVATEGAAVKIITSTSFGHERSTGSQVEKGSHRKETV